MSRKSDEYTRIVVQTVIYNTREYFDVAKRGKIANECNLEIYIILTFLRALSTFYFLFIYKNT